MSDKTRKSGESELGSAGETAVPILAPGIGTRIKAVCDAIGSRESASKAAGVSTDMLYRYFREESTPSFEAIVGLAARSGFNLDWLATGEGPELRDSGVGETAARYQGFELPESFEARMERLDWAKRLVQAALRSAGLVEDDRLSTLLLGLVFEGGWTKAACAR